MNINSAMDNVRRNFTPGGPIKNFDRFKGRTDELQTLISVCGNVGQHAIIFGDRSIGKTSLAYAAADLSCKRFEGLEMVRVACDAESTFLDVADRICEKLAIESNVPEKTNSTKSEKGGGIKAVVDVAGKKEVSESTKSVAGEIPMSPSRLADLIGERKCLILVDEYDLISGHEDRKRFAQFLKALSDQSESVTVFLTGIGRNVNQLMHGHESLVRNLKQVRVSRMKDEEIHSIITYGLAQCDLLMDESVKTSITHLAGGMPYFAHLLAGRAAENAINKKSSKIEDSHFVKAVSSLQTDTEIRLLGEWRSAINIPHQGTDGQRVRILGAAAKRVVLSQNGDFSPVEIIDYVVQNYTRSDLEQLKQIIRELSRGQDSILRDEGDGYYRFENPLMPQFIKVLRYGEPEK